MAEFGSVEADGKGGSEQFVRKTNRACDLGLQITRRNAVIAIKLHIIEGCSDTMPPRHSDGFSSADARGRDGDDVAQAQGLADQNDFKLDGGANRQFPGAKKIDTRGTDVASDKGYREFLAYFANTAKAQRKVKAGTGVFALLWMDAYGVRRHAHETPRLLGTQKRRHAQRREAPSVWNQLWARLRLARLFGTFVRPRFKCDYSLRRAHQALRDAT
jgi:hypothetical protein